MSHRRRNSLTARSVRAFWLFGLALVGAFAVIFAVIVAAFVIQLEDRSYARRVTVEMDRIIERIDDGAEIRTVLPSTSFLQGYVGAASLPAELRPHLQGRPDGAVELGGPPWSPLRDLEYHVAIRTLPRSGERLFLLHDVSGLEIDEGWGAAQPWVLAAGLAVIVPLGLWWGRRLAGQVVAPIVELAHHVERSRAGELAPPLEDREYPAEVAVLAEALRRAAGRVEQFLARERRFTRNASHELRTPLTVIRGAAQLLEESMQPVDEQPRRLVGRIARSVDRMEEIIDAFLWLAREADGQLTSETCRLEELLPALIEQHRHLIRDKEVEVRVEPGEGLPVSAPEPVLAIVVGNLLANALANTAHGWVRIRIEENLLVISDTGRGIEPERLETITRPYVTGGAGGHGLGLAIVQEICERFEWRLELESRPGEGTRAMLRF